MIVKQGFSAIWWWS